MTGFPSELLKTFPTFASPWIWPRESSYGRVSNVDLAHSRRSTRYFSSGASRPGNRGVGESKPPNGEMFVMGIVLGGEGSS